MALVALVSDAKMKEILTATWRICFAEAYQGYQQYAQQYPQQYAPQQYAAAPPVSPSASEPPLDALVEQMFHGQQLSSCGVY